jgi:hypothetical protein
LTGVVTGQYLTRQPAAGPANSGATVLDFHQLPCAVTQQRRYRRSSNPVNRPPKSSIAFGAQVWRGLAPGRVVA